jgi:hypothetical protein
MCRDLANEPGGGGVLTSTGGYVSAVQQAVLQRDPLATTEKTCRRCDRRGFLRSVPEVQAQKVLRSRSTGARHATYTGKR